jgi:2,3-diketo-5-methylthiopentyl-1-phosphate enolase
MIAMIEVTYRIESSKEIDIQKKAKAIALGQTTDTWTPTARSGLAKLRKHTAEILATKAVSSQDNHFIYEATVEFPPANTENDIPSLLTMIFGKISLDGKLKLVDIAFPKGYLRGKGPKFGIEGIRKLVREPKKPLAMAIFKPCVGLSPKELADMFYALALGGMHLVKDDEILPDLSICPTEKRLDACLEAGERARKETGQRTLYAVNLTGPVSQLMTKAKRLARKGAQCFLFNVLSYGYGALEELNEIGVPIMAHPALAGGWCGSPEYGLSYRVALGSLMRLGGADIVLFPSSYGTVALPKSQTDEISKALVEPLALRRAFPGPSAGIHPGLVPQILRDYGSDVIINAGGGVHGHPGGARAGAQAFRQAIDFALRSIDYKTLAASDAPELTEALKLWGHG